MTVPEVSFMDYLETTKEAQPITTSEMYHVLLMWCVRLAAKFKVETEICR